ncbi:acyl-[acyl-carrier-protein]--UDP-N-acetylglucosamine O-acyltransferase, partial [bacterium]|nr:acyl-[acyl-carrier-protein]--UDP-N-acetylglucosamine O-acyltransferase [bacterium]NIN92575.1 acyl-[acyl-carrier-protein]--UDP-N-acetylglucosamine O-acyltransferase [bacterium]NIO18617.1 acyl-[acyl-carrier-protein]--UDP-N-acetylglucosamine O-acyltransferase [bacterium]NIO73632.1 acyl-[acyl-carrier-protein]--UDP-N-acetylglucosamine O-acyltransferase [bacterium]
KHVKAQLKRAYKVLFRSKLNTTQALNVLEKESNISDELLHMISFIKESERGICKE